ncbi:MAG: SURF1 family protein [Acidimicrobiia bacterium]|nr:SURF1 family protein [Acidimicrobiia bacterium]
MRTLLRPRWIAGHLLAIVAVVAFVDLGFWQLRRHDEKVALRDAVAAAQALPPVPIDEAPGGSYRRVVATGTFDGSLQTKVLRSQKGVSGYHVITPFLFDEGRAVLVDRGCVPLDAEPPGPFARLTEIEGTLWPAEEGSSIPDTLTPAVRRIDPEIQAAFADYELLGEYLLLTGHRYEATGLPVLPEAPEIPLGPHLGYAGQWFLFAAVVLVGYPMLLRARADRRTPESGIGPILS